MIGVSPSRFASACRIAIRPDRAPGDELAAARTVIAGFSRMVVVSVALFVSIGVIALLHDLPVNGSDPLLALLTGGRTLIVDVLYALVLQALLIQPLLIRLDRAAFRDSAARLFRQNGYGALTGTDQLAEKWSLSPDAQATGSNARPRAR